MSSKRPTKTPQIIVEPNSLAQSAIREILSALDRQFGPDPKPVIEAMRAFAAEVGFDVFSALADSPQSGVQQVGLKLESEAAILAYSLVHNFSGTLNLVLKNTQANPGERNRLLSEYMLTRQELGANLAQFLAKSEKDQAVAHLLRISDLFNDTIFFNILRVTQNVTSQQAVKLGNKIEALDPTLMAAREHGGFIYNIIEHPKLIGVAFAHLAVDLILGEQTLITAEATPETIAENLKATRTNMLAGLSQPLPPGLLSQHTLRAISAFRRSGPAPGGKWN